MTDDRYPEYRPGPWIVFGVVLALLWAFTGVLSVVLQVSK